MKQLLLLLAIVVCPTFAANAQYQKFSPDELKEDLALYKQALFEVHPNSFEWYPQDSFDLWIAQIDAQLTGPMTHGQFKKLLLPLHQKVGCGHSRIANPGSLVKQLNKEYKKGASRKFLPFTGKVVNGKFYVLKDFTQDNMLPAGTEITQINDLAMPVIIDSLSLFLTSDGYNTTHFHQAINKNFTGLYRTFFGEDDQFDLEYIDSLGAKKVDAFPALVKTRALEKQKAKKLKKSPPARDTSIVKTKNLLFRKNGYRFLQSVADTSMYILRIPKFTGKKGIRFYKKTLNYLNSLPGAKELIVDLRQNGGGDALEATALISMLCPESFSFEISCYEKLPKGFYKHLSTNSFARWRNKTALTIYAKDKKLDEKRTLRIDIEPNDKVRYTGPLYVFIDGYSFSASSLVSAYIQDQDRALFFGEETGGGKFGTNALKTPFLSLPNTGLRVRMPRWQIRQLVAGKNKGRGIFPDVPIKWTIEDLLERKDPELEKLIQLKKEFKEKKARKKS